MPKHTTRIPRILMPKAGTDLAKWAVIACDQYTSQPEYWEKLDREVGARLRPCASPCPRFTWRSRT